jgi:hypothetical protein
MNKINQFSLVFPFFLSLFLLAAASSNIVIYENNFQGYVEKTHPAGWVDENNCFSLYPENFSNVYTFSSGIGTKGISYYNGQEISKDFDYYTVTAALAKGTGVDIGVIGCIKDNYNYYKFSWLNTGILRLEKIVSGSSTILASKSNPSAMPDGIFRLFKLEIKPNYIKGILYSQINPDNEWTDDNLSVVDSLTFLDTNEKFVGKAGIYASFESAQNPLAQAGYFQVYANESLYENNFSGYLNSEDPPGWFDISNKWLTEPYSGSSSYRMTGTTGTETITYYSDNTVERQTFYTIDAAMMKAAGDGPGVIGGISDDWTSYYLLRWNYDLDKLELIKVSNASRITLGYGTVQGALPNWQFLLFRLEVQNSKICGKLLTKRVPELDWQEDNLVVVDSICFDSVSNKFFGGAGLYGVFGRDDGYNYVGSNFFRVLYANSQDYNWQSYPGYYTKSDLNKDCYIDFNDFVLLSEQWLICNDPEDVLCIQNW